VKEVPVNEPQAFSSRAPEDQTAALEFARRVFESVSDWYKNADAKAQVLLVLDGGFLTFLTSSVFAKPDEVSHIVGNFKFDTWILLSLMSATLTASIVSALLCLWSRTYRKVQLDEWYGELGIVKDQSETYAPEVMWFFQLVWGLEKNPYQKRLLTVTKEFEIQALGSQIFELSRNVTRKHYWVNLGFISAGTTLVLFMAAIFSYITRLPH
jgi:hypothetical protein